MNRREFIQALAACGVVATVGVDLIPRFSGSAIRSALQFSEVYSIEWDCYIRHAMFRNGASLIACSDRGEDKPATPEEREAFLSVAAEEIATFLNNAERVA